MTQYNVRFEPISRQVKIEKGKTLLQAAIKANILLKNICGGDGICCRCKMKLNSGILSGDYYQKLSAEDIRKQFVLSCLAKVESDIIVELPQDIFIAKSFSDLYNTARIKTAGNVEIILKDKSLTNTPVVRKIYLEMQKPSLANNLTDYQRILVALEKKLDYQNIDIDLDVLKKISHVLRQNDYKITVCVGFLHRDHIKIIDIVPGNTADQNCIIIIDIGTTTLISQLIDAESLVIVNECFCYNSQIMHGRDVTTRIIFTEKNSPEELQDLIVNDLNRLIQKLVYMSGIDSDSITAVICTGNTIMSHFLFALPASSIRKKPYVPVTIKNPVIEAKKLNLNINRNGLVYNLPGISGWVGSDISAGILATGIYKNKDLCLLVDVGTNGEIVLGNKDWLACCSASAGPALEGANEECGMNAENGAIEKVFLKKQGVCFQTISSELATGLCGSGIIDLVRVLLDAGIIDRSGRFTENAKDIKNVNGIKRYVLADVPNSKKQIYFTESDIENVISAKAAIFAAIKIMVQRFELKFTDIQHFYLAGSFGSTINITSAKKIGLIPDIAPEKIQYVGNTSLKGAKIAALSREARDIITKISDSTTYYDLMGEDDYVQEFQKALFLPHTDLEMFKRN